MHRIPISVAVLALHATAQDAYWVANRSSNNLSQIDAGGNTLRTVAMPTSLRSCHVAPDGKVWVVRFIQPTFDIFDPASGTITPVPFAFASVYEIAFDQAGHAWASGGNATPGAAGVQEFDANGVSVNTFPLGFGTCLGITVDNQGNKWVAQGSTASVTRIAVGTNAITNHPIGLPTTMSPTRVVADYRDVLSPPVAPSHVWVVGDNSNAVAEFDNLGNYVNQYPLATGAQVSSLAADRAGDIWIGDFRNGNIFHVAGSTGLVLSTFPVGPTCLGLAFDGFERLWTTVRITITGQTPPCEVRRLAANGDVEVPAIVGVATQTALSTRYHHALVVDPFGDLDGDGNPNVIELLGGSSPFDRDSNIVSLTTTGSSRLAAPSNLVHVGLQAPATVVTGLAFSVDTIPATPIPGIDGALQIGPVIATLPPAAGSFGLDLAIGNDPALNGFDLYVQGIVFAGLVNPALTNRASLRVWL